MMKKAVPITEVIDADQVLAALIAFKKGDFSVRLPVNQVGLAGKLIDNLNDIFELNETMCREMVRVSPQSAKKEKSASAPLLPPHTARRVRSDPTFRNPRQPVPNSSALATSPTPECCFF